jgi:hypothetical protein
MVHGNYYGAQYEIYLNKQVDFYNDILPIWTSVRARIEYELSKIGNGKCKLVIIPYKKLDNRFEKLEHTRNYVSANDTITFNNSLTRENNFEEFKYYDVKNYKNLIKHFNNLPEPISTDKLESLEESYKTIRKNCYDVDFWNKYSEKEQMELNTETADLLEKLKIQRIIARPEYFEEIVRLEKSLTDIILSDKENELVQKVLNHPNLEGLIESHGINLIEGFY